MAESRLHIVVGSDGVRVTFGNRQAEWLLEGGHAELVRFEQTSPAGGINFYRSALTGDEVNALVLEEPAMRECDFCRAPAPAWRLKVRPFRLTKGPVEAPFDRDVFVCEVCEPFVRSNDKAGLIERTIAETITYAEASGGALAAHVAGLSRRQIEAGLGPMVRELVSSVFANRRGYPQRDDVGGEA